MFSLTSDSSIQSRRDHPIHPPKATILIILAEGNHPTIRSAGILSFQLKIQNCFSIAVLSRV